MQLTYYSEHSKVRLSVDVIIFGFEENKLKVLIGRRQMDPGRGEWSLYGGFVNEDESLDEAAERTLQQLTGLKRLYMQQIGAFGSVDRDPGERVVSVAYYALINVKDYSEKLQHKYGLEWMSLDALPHLYSDHNKMVQQAIRMMRQKIKTEPISFQLLPPLFTLTQLQHVFEAVLNNELDKRNFRKRIKEMDYIEKTDLIDKESSKRGACLYRFNKKAYNEESNFKL